MSTATVRGIASTLGVSPATVSRSLNHSADVSDSVRARVIAEAKRVGYEFVRKSPRTGRVGLLFFDETTGPRYSGYDAIIWGAVARAALSVHYDVCTINTLDRKPGESFGAFATRKGVEGLLVRVDEESRNVATEIAAAGVPHVVIADRFEDPSVNYVYCNSLQASRDAVAHLLQLGHRRIAIAHNTVRDTDHCDRIRAYVDVLASADVAVDSDLVVPISAEIGGGAAAFNRLMSLREPPTALFLTDPQLSLGVLRRAHEVGIRVPDELSIVGVDDERLRKTTHPIFTAVCQNAAELGHQAARWLCRQLARGTRGVGEPPRLQSELDAFLEINQTTAPPPAQAVRMTPSGRRLPNGQGA